MFGKNISMDVFHRRVLKCVQEKKWTTEEIWICYLKSYPQGLIEKVLVHPVTKAKIVLALHNLVIQDLVHKEVTNFTDQPLDEETEIFWISNKGRSFHLSKK